MTYFALAARLVFAALRPSSGPLWSRGPTWFLANPRWSKDYVSILLKKIKIYIYFVQNNVGVDTLLHAGPLIDKAHYSRSVWLTGGQSHMLPRSGMETNCCVKLTTKLFVKTNPYPDKKTCNFKPKHIDHCEVQNPS